MYVSLSFSSSFSLPLSLFAFASLQVEQNTKYFVPWATEFVCIMKLTNEGSCRNARSIKIQSNGVENKARRHFSARMSIDCLQENTTTLTNSTLSTQQLQ